MTVDQAHTEPPGELLRRLRDRAEVTRQELAGHSAIRQSPGGPAQQRSDLADSALIMAMLGRARARTRVGEAAQVRPLRSLRSPLSPLHSLCRRAHSEVWTVGWLGPAHSDGSQPRLSVLNGIVAHAVDRGVAVARILDQEVLDLPRPASALQAAFRPGTTTRLLSRPAFDLAIVDRSRALVRVQDSSQHDECWLIADPESVHELVLLHRLLWSVASPVGQDPPDAAPEDLRPVLRCLAAGTKDDVACERLGLSPRSYSRRVASLQAHLGVNSRFQAGVRAARRGWIG